MPKIPFGLASDEVTGQYWRGLRSYCLGFSVGAPARKYPNTGPIVTKWLLDHGLIEIVQNPAYRNDACYRLTPLGVRVLERGQSAKPSHTRPEPGGLAKMLERLIDLVRRLASARAAAP